MKIDRDDKVVYYGRGGIYEDILERFRELTGFDYLTTEHVISIRFPDTGEDGVLEPFLKQEKKSGRIHRAIVLTSEIKDNGATSSGIWLGVDADEFKGTARRYDMRLFQFGVGEIDTRGTPLLARFGRGKQ